MLSARMARASALALKNKASQIKEKELQESKAANERAEDVGCKRGRTEKDEDGNAKRVAQVISSLGQVSVLLVLHYCLMLPVKSMCL